MNNKLDWKKLVKTSFKIFGIIMLLIILIAFTSKPKPNNDSVVNNEVVPVFDLNSLYEKNIDQIVTVLGKPANDTEPTSLQMQTGNITEWEKTFNNEGQRLLVTYNPSTRKVVDFFIDTIDPSGATKDVSSIIKIAGTPSVDKFTTKPVPTIRDKTVYTGVVFIPNK